jgi:hypothetical protein
MGIPTSLFLSDDIQDGSCQICTNFSDISFEKCKLDRFNFQSPEELVIEEVACIPTF